MKKQKQIINLSEFRTRDGNSQNAEDGIIIKLFELCKINSGFLVEIGSWDGIYLSNMRTHYQRNPEFKTMQVEASHERFQQLVKCGLPWNENNIFLNLNVEPNGENGLNAIFDKYIPEKETLALLSIDIDGPDLKVFQALDIKKYRPAVVIIEHENWQSPASLTSLESEFKKRGYNIVYCTGNFIFIDEKYGIKNTESINKLVKKSGNPEFMHYFKEITEFQYREYVHASERGENIFIGLCGEQNIEFKK